MLLYRINEKDRTVSIVWSINKKELLNAAEKEEVYTFDDILSQLEDFRNNRSEIFENIRITMMNGLNERIKVDALAESIKPTILENSENIFFKYYSNLLTIAYMNIGEPILMPKDYVKERFNHKKLVEQARNELQKHFDEILQAMNDERNFDYSTTGGMLVATPQLQLAVIRTEDTNSVYRIADKPLLTFFYEFSYAIFDAGLKVCECRFCNRHFLGTENSICCDREECLAENKKLKNQQIRQNRKNSIYTHETDNYNAYVRNQKKELKIAKVSLIVMDDFEMLKQKCKTVVDSKKKECEEFGLPVDELIHTIDEQEAVIKAFKNKALAESEQ
ncbi:MAG: hypothetical protein NC320_00505 [Clostridium sp.]|nr:hypothetical protein [Clostridium sp.]